MTMAHPRIVVLMLSAVNSIGMSSGFQGMLIFLRAVVVLQWRREDASKYGFPGMIVPGVKVAVVILVGVEEMVDVNCGVITIP